MIPKKIHYCWFGRKPLNKLATKCLDSWKKHFPDYEIIEWNEDNYDVHVIPYTSQAYKAKRYAFVSDYVRFDVLYKEGGIYLDVDVEVLKPLDPLLSNHAYMGFEHERYVNPGLGIGSVPEHPLMKDILQHYQKRNFLKKNNRFDYTTVVHIVTKILVEKGLKLNNQLQTIDQCTIYPKEYFQPIDHQKQTTQITEKTYSIHHYATSWYPVHKKILKFLSRAMGPKITKIVKKILRRDI